MPARKPADRMSMWSSGRRRADPASTMREAVAHIGASAPQSAGYDRKGKYAALCRTTHTKRKPTTPGCRLLRHNLRSTVSKSLQPRQHNSRRILYKSPIGKYVPTINHIRGQVYGSRLRRRSVSEAVARLNSKSELMQRQRKYMTA